MQHVLSLVWFKVFPPQFGGQKGIALFLKHLSAHFQVDCLCSGNNAAGTHSGCKVYPQLPVSKLQFFNPVVWLKVRRWTKKSNYNFVILEQPYYGLLGAYLKRLGFTIIIHTHNIESMRFKAIGKKAWPLLFYYERWCLQQAHSVVFKSEQDKAFAKEKYSVKEENSYVLPYGVENAQPFDRTLSRRFLQAQHGIPENHKVLLFAGTLDYHPNAQAVEFIYEMEPELRKILSNYTIIICGRNCFPDFEYLNRLENPHIVKAGFVNEIDHYFAGADIFINPVKNFHGVQTKLFDALSYNLNVVCFSVIAKELPAYLGTKIFTPQAYTEDAFARQVVSASEQSTPTPEAFFRQFCWSALVAKFAQHLKSRFN